ncbi:DUF2975 domain-containing protein [Cellulomonas shaoxiangyii]|uniref:DUF2975 domain-containing protein n=1 Tax=Cellulomonas shaoxiangyii TaxID=2566013 RepID=A0A4P7SLK2_9CELL|nr:DUF2975 domain-containing protein [Cellulomonas shaoxiangyii]QCB94821.1 DUF2975 domain-containing protein [Cellulomonas shaoxiangyii]TGY86551.1 DUF2975 domain-containing protein [Cellulomonas shaoxiangyii]
MVGWGRVAVLASRAVIVVVLGGTLVLQLYMLPSLLADVREEEGALELLRLPVLALTILMVACVQVALVCVWRLLTMVRRDTVFSPAAFRWLDVVTGAAVVECLLFLLLGALLAPGEAVPPGVVLMLGVVGAGFLGIALLVLLMRSLLAKAVALDTTATTLRAELDEVI